MAKTDLGNKRVCPDCNAKFFDLNKRPVVCPKCEFSYDPDALARKAVKKPAPADTPKAASKEEAKSDEADEADNDEAEEQDEVEETEDEKELTLDDDAIISGSGDEDDDGDGASGASLPAGYTEEGVEDDADVLADDEEDIDLDEAEDIDSED